MLERATIAGSDVIEVVHRMLGDENAGWHIGTFGAIAEFHHVVEDPPAAPKLSPSGGEVVTARGGLHVGLGPEVLMVAYEGLSSRPDAWTHGIVFCLPTDSARLSERTVLSEVGVDTEALRPEDRSGVLFDLGLGAPHVDFCVRAADPALINALRDCCGQSVLDPASTAMAAIMAGQPHRICLSRLGRVEVYQGIPPATKGAASPVGPHTHVLPDFLSTRRTHSANTPIPDGWLPALFLHPRSAVTDRLGQPRAFDPVAFDAFQELLDAYGPPGFFAEKRRVLDAVQAGLDPRDYVAAETRENRRATRVALRQAQHTMRDVAPLQVWLNAVDRGRGTCAADDDNG